MFQKGFTGRLSLAALQNETAQKKCKFLVQASFASTQHKFPTINLRIISNHLEIINVEI